MATFGKVLDLLDDRYLKLQDVTGNVEPIPTMVPYQQYTEKVLVYRMDTPPYVFMGLLQDFTMRVAQEKGKELWTWCVQWEVEDPNLCVPTLKKPRLDGGQSDTSSDAQHTKRKAPAMNIVERRTIDPDLMQEEELLRMLIAIVQVDSSLVPNCIEFLYRWIDYHDGDGKALKAALRHDIPSLWDFEDHPLVLPYSIRVTSKLNATEGNKNVTLDAKSPIHDSVKKQSWSSSTKKVLEKPDLAIMEGKIEESERLRYREVKYGIQPPKLNQPIPPLINIPRDVRKRTKYYAACFKSRQCALSLLIEAGITTSQISNYKSRQKDHPRDTICKTEGRGLRHYYKDAQSAQIRYLEVEKEMAFREKMMEITISNRLATEALLAARNAGDEGPSSVPLVLPTSNHGKRAEAAAAAAAITSRIRAAKALSKEKIGIVPTPLVRRMKSKLFEGSVDKQTLTSLGYPPTLDRLPDYSTTVLQAGLRAAVREYDEMHTTTLDPAADPDAPPEFQEFRTSALQADPYASQLTYGCSEFPSQPFSWTADSRYDTLANMQNNGHYHSSESAQRLVALLSDGARQLLSSGSGVPSTFSSVLNPSASASTTLPAPASSLPHLPPLPTLPALPPLPALPTLPPIASAANQSPHPGHPLTLPLRPPTTAVFPTLTSNSSLIDSLSRGFDEIERSIASRSLAMPPPPAPVLGNSQPSLYEDPRRSSVTSGPNNSMMLASLDRPMPSQSASSALIQSASQTQQTSQPDLPYAAHTSFLPYAAGPSTPGMYVTSAQRPDNAEGWQDSTLQAQRMRNALSDSLDESSAPGMGLNSTYGGAFIPSGYPSGLSAPFQVPQQFGAPPQPTLYVTAASQAANSFAPAPLQLPPYQNQSNYSEAPGPSLSQPHNNTRRVPPSPLNLAGRPPSPLTSLAPSLLATSPFAATTHSVPIQIYFPKVVVPGNLVGPGGAKLGDGCVAETDALLLGSCTPGSGKIVLSTAIFLPVGVWANTLRRAGRGTYRILETYEPVTENHPAKIKSSSPHGAAYAKLRFAHSLISRSSDRETSLTKRWRTTPGPLTQRDRGSIWEGWGVTLDAAVELGVRERTGALSWCSLIDEGIEKKVGGGLRVGDGPEVVREVMRRRRLIEEILAEEEDKEGEDWNMDSDGDVDMAG